MMLNAYAELNAGIHNYTVNRNQINLHNSQILSKILPEREKLSFQSHEINSIDMCDHDHDHKHVFLSFCPICLLCFFFSFLFFESGYVWHRNLILLKDVR